MDKDALFIITGMGIVLLVVAATLYFRSGMF